MMKILASLILITTFQAWSQTVEQHIIQSLTMQTAESEFAKELTGICKIITGDQCSVLTENHSIQFYRIEKLELENKAISEECTIPVREHIDDLVAEGDLIMKKEYLKVMKEIETKISKTQNSAIKDHNFLQVKYIAQLEIRQNQLILDCEAKMGSVKQPTTKNVPVKKSGESGKTVAPSSINKN